jgi:hypothetical protein
VALIPRQQTAPPKKHEKTVMSAGEDVGYRFRNVDDAYPAITPNPTAPSKCVQIFTAPSAPQTGGITCFIVDVPDTVEACFEGIELSAVSAENKVIVALVFRGLVQRIQHERLEFVVCPFGDVFYALCE